MAIHRAAKPNRQGQIITFPKTEPMQEVSVGFLVPQPINMRSGDKRQGLKRSPNNSRSGNSSSASRTVDSVPFMGTKGEEGRFRYPERRVGGFMLED